MKREAKEHRNPSAEKCRHLAVCFSLSLSSKSWVALSHLRALDLDQSSHSFPRCFSLCCRSARECEGSSLLSLSASQRHSFTHSHSHSLTVRDAGNRETANYDTITSPFSCRRQSPLSCSRPLALVRSLCSLPLSLRPPPHPPFRSCAAAAAAASHVMSHAHMYTGRPRMSHAGCFLRSPCPSLVRSLSQSLVSIVLFAFFARLLFSLPLSPVPLGSFIACLQAAVHRKRERENDLPASRDECALTERAFRGESRTFHDNSITAAS